MANIQKPSISVSNLVMDEKETQEDVIMVPCDPNKENIEIQENISHNTSFSAEVMEVEPGSQEKLMVLEHSSVGNKITVDETSSAESESDDSMSLDENMSPRVSSKKLTPSSEPEDGELDYEDEIGCLGETPRKGKLPDDITEKLNERAKRFGINVCDESTVSEEDLFALYKSLAIPVDLVRSGKLKNVRLDTISMRGVHEMSTSDVNNYFEMYRPISVEWINDVSCNVLFRSDLSAAKAMLELSEEISPREKSAASHAGSEAQEKENGDNFMEDPKQKKFEIRGDRNATEKQNSISGLFTRPAPPGTWRKGQSVDKGQSIFLQFAKKDDEKLPNVEKRSSYYKKYGNPNYGGLSGYQTTSRKRDYPASFRKEGDDLEMQSSHHIAPRSFHDSALKSETQDNINVEFEPYPVRPFRRYVRRVASSRAPQHTSPVKRRPFQERDSDSDDDENTLSAGGKKIRMRMYADSVKGAWQRVNSSPKIKEGSNRIAKAPSRAQSSTLHSDDSSDDTREKPSFVKSNIPSRYKIWNPIAESMAREAELAEESPHYRSSGFQHSLFQNDLRSKISSVPSTSQSYGRVSKSKGADVDLRKKLQKMRRGDSKTSHRSPLLISVQNKHDDSSDSSF